MDLKIVVLSIILARLSFTQAEVGFQILGVNENRTDLYILENSHDFLIPNLKREDVHPAQIKLSLSGNENIKILQLHQYTEGKGEWTMSLSDGSQLILTLEESLSATTYKFWWHSTKPEVKELCVHYSGKYNTSWYHAYQSPNPHWPMDPNISMTSEAFSTLGAPKHASSTKDNFYLILEHLFFSTDGFAVYLDALQPLFLRRDPNHGDALLCFTINATTPYPPASTEPEERFYTDLNLYLFAAKDIRHVVDYVLQHSELIPKPSDTPDPSIFKFPTWSDGDGLKTQKDILDLAANIEKYDFPNQSLIMLDDSLTVEYGNQEFDRKRFPDPKQMIQTLHNKGFQLGFGLQPNFPHQLIHPIHTSDYFIKDVHNQSTSWVDFTNSEACTWYEYLLRRLHFEYGVDCYQLSSVVPQESSNLVYSNATIQKFPALAATKYIQTVARLGGKVISELGYRTQDLSIFVKFTSTNSTSFENLLESIIPNALALSIAGYSSFIPYPIGGFNPQVKPSAELYIRWVQAATFLPAMSFSHKPWSYGSNNNETLLNVTRNMVALHQTHWWTFVHLAQFRYEVGWPIIRPLWYLEPDDAQTYSIKDQFMVGDDLLVAPVLKEGQREREVYFPKGIWIDQHGKRYSGGGWAKVKVPLEELAYFNRGWKF